MTCVIMPALQHADAAIAGAGSKRSMAMRSRRLEIVSFWGDTAKNMLLWGNYENPVFRDWIRMKMDSVADHVKMVKGLIGEKPLMTCCSSTGPITLNSIALNLERMAPYLDYFHA